MRFLIADHDHALGLFLVRGLESEGYEAVWTADGQEVLDKFEVIRPDLVILDLNLPKRDGTDVLRAIRSWRDEVPIPVLTSRADTETMGATRAYGLNSSAIQATKSMINASLEILK